MKLYVQVCPRCGTDLYLPDPARGPPPRAVAGPDVYRSQVRTIALAKPSAVADDRGLLRVAVEALLDRDRHLLGGDAALDRLDHELGGVELLLAQDELGEDGGADRAVAVGAVGDLGAGDEARRAG